MKKEEDKADVMDQESNEKSREFVVGNELGIHARPAALLVKTASQFTADIMLHKEEIAVSAKSIIGVLTLEGHSGVTLKVSANGDDATEALDALQELFENNFNEE